MDWSALMALGLGRLRLAPETFWAMTPRELAAAAGPTTPLPRISRAEFAALQARFPDAPPETETP